MDSQQPPPRVAIFSREDRCGRPCFSQISMQCKIKTVLDVCGKKTILIQVLFGEMICYTIIQCKIELYVCYPPAIFSCTSSYTIG